MFAYYCVVRDYGCISEEVRVKDLGEKGLAIDANVFPNAVELTEDENLGRLNTTTMLGDADGDGGA